jgi:hypothetical protein
VVVDKSKMTLLKFLLKKRKKKNKKELQKNYKVYNKMMLPLHLQGSLILKLFSKKLNCMKVQEQ